MDLDCENFAGTIRPDDICLADEVQTENVLSGKIGVRTFLERATSMRWRLPPVS